jgi:hypothetical protein
MNTSSARRVLAATLAAATLAVPTALTAPTALAAPSVTPSAEEPPPNERAPRVPDAPDLGDAPWTSSVARDVEGYRLSTYTGKYYDKRFEQYRLCVVQRESGGGGYANYRTVSGSFHGAYQFGTGWNSAASLVQRLRPEMERVYGNAAAQQLNELSSTPVSRWNRFWQDAAFWTVFNLGAGWRQWQGGSWFCDHAPNAEAGWPGNPRGFYGKGSLERDRGAQDKGSKDRTERSTPRAGTPEHNLLIAREFIRDRHGWRYPEFKALKAMWWRESNWRHDVINNHPNGPWYGLGQVNGGFIASRGYSIREYMRSPLAQIKVGTAYIKERYGSPTKAWSFWQSNGWY